MPTSTDPPPTEPPQTQADILTHLQTTNAFEDLHQTLQSSLQRMGWTEKIRKLALELLRAGRCERFDEVVDAVVATAQGRKEVITNLGSGGKGGADAETEAYFEDVDVRVPRVVVEQGVRALKEVLGEVVVLEGEDENGRDAAAEEGKAAAAGEKNVGVNGALPKSKKPTKGAE